MGFFKKISNALSSGPATGPDPEIWRRVTSDEDVESILSASNSRPQIVFKHSTSCGVSFFAMRSLNTPEILENQNIDLHLIDVIQQHSISQGFAEKVNIRHESPQIFVLKNGEVHWHGSHNSVNAKNVLNHIV